MILLRHFLSRVSEDLLLLCLLLALVPLLLLMPDKLTSLPQLVDWKTVAALAGLMVLSRGLEESGYLVWSGRWLLTRIHGERLLALVIVIFSALLAALVTNDVALFIVVPLTLGLRRMADLPIGRLIIFEALAVNAGSTLSPIGNPQNLFIWQAYGSSFLEFTLTMLPLGLLLTLLLVVLIPFAFPAQRITLNLDTDAVTTDKRLLRLTLPLYPLFLIATDLGHAVIAALAVVALFLLTFRHVLRGVDWLLLLVFVLMFIDLGLLASLPLVRELAGGLDALPGGIFAAAILGSQVISNVPAAIFLQGFTDQWQALAWGVSVGGFGLAIGSLANLIALRLARQKGLWIEFHAWSIPVLLLSSALAWGLLQWMPFA